MDFDREFRLKDSQALHIEVMRVVAQQLKDTPYVLKGGSALILTRSLNRYSTDLDFDSQIKLNLAGRIETALKRIREIELRSLKVVKDTDTVQRYKIHYVDKRTGEDTLLKVETSFRDIPQPESIETIDGIKTYGINTLFDQKMNAAANRAEARDLYDLAFLIKQYGSRLRDDQIEAVQSFAMNPDQMVEQYRASFKVDDALANVTTVEDIALSIHLDSEELFKQRNLKVQESSYQTELNLRATKCGIWLTERFGNLQPDGTNVWAVDKYIFTMEGNNLNIFCNERNHTILQCQDGEINGKISLKDIKQFEGAEKAAKAEIRKQNLEQRKRGHSR
jgi:predicted nucleotidyltransferase component of viral defense system